MAGAVALALYSVIVCHLLVRARLRALPATSHDANPRLAVLAQGRWYEYLIRFALGGGATVFTGLISSRYGAAVGGLFLALPAIFCASASLIEKHEIRRKREAGLSGERRGKMAAALDSAGAAWGSPSVLPRGRRQGAQACGVG
ncbi:DUF3147 family protein [Bradyrhizobium sp. 186]|nr:DUF3147 family protein [Bradyrhizobium sp. 186]